MIVDGVDIAPYLKSSINHNENIIVNNVSIEYLMVDIYREHVESITLLTVYRPDNIMDTIFFGQHDMIFYCATSNNKESVIVGDFNIDMLGDGSFKERLNRVMNIYQHTLHIHKPTRETDTSSTLLDHIWTSNPEYIK